MAHNPQQGVLSPLLPTSSYILNRNIFIQNLLKMPLNQVNGNPTHNNMDKSSTNTVNSSTDAAIKKDGPQPQPTKNLVHCIIKGTIKSLLCTAVAPIDRVQFLMQCQNELLKTGRLSSPYKGMKDCFLRTIKHDGFFSLWRGNSVSVLTTCAFEAWLFVGPNVTRREKSDPPSSLLPVAILFGNLFLYPFHYARIRLANDVKPPTGIMHFSLDSSTPKSLTNNTGNNRQFSGVFDVVKKTIMSDGFGGLYRGYTSACIGILASSHAFGATRECFTTYTKEKQNQKTQKLVSIITLYFMLYVSLPLAFYPFKTVSYRMMMTSGEANKYKGPMNALYQIVRKEGVSALYKGATPHVISRIAGTSITAMLLYFAPISRIAFT